MVSAKRKTNPVKPWDFDLVYPDDWLPLLLFPLTGLAIIAEEIRDRALAELGEKPALQEELLRHRMSFESDEITREEYEERAAKLLAELDTIEEYEKKRQEDKHS